MEVWCARRESNPYTEVLDPKSSVSANSTTRAYYGAGKGLRTLTRYAQLFESCMSTYSIIPAYWCG